MSAERSDQSKKPRKADLRGAYVVKAAETRPSVPRAKTPPPGYVPPRPTAEDKAVVAALFRARGLA